MERKKSAILLLLLTIFFLAFSIFFMTSEASHNCAGEDCPICEQIAICKRTIEELGLGIVATLLIASAVFGGIYKFIFAVKNEIKKDSLISLKIEMLN